MMNHNGIRIMCCNAYCFGAQHAGVEPKECKDASVQTDFIPPNREMKAVDEEEERKNSLFEQREARRRSDIKQRRSQSRRVTQTPQGPYSYTENQPMQDDGHMQQQQQQQPQQQQQQQEFTDDAQRLEPAGTNKKKRSNSPQRIKVDTGGTAQSSASPESTARRGRMHGRRVSKSLVPDKSQQAAQPLNQQSQQQQPSTNQPLGGTNAQGADRRLSVGYDSQKPPPPSSKQPQAAAVDSATNLDSSKTAPAGKGGKKGGGKRKKKAAAAEQQEAAEVAADLVAMHREVRTAEKKVSSLEKQLQSKQDELDELWSLLKASPTAPSNAADTLSELKEPRSDDLDPKIVKVSHVYNLCLYALSILTHARVHNFIQYDDGMITEE